MKHNSLVLPFIPLILLLMFSCQSTMSRGDLAKEYFNIGNAFYDLGEVEKAVEYYKRATSLDKSLMSANYNLARAYLEQGQLEKGRAILNLLLEKDPENVLVLETLGYSWYKDSNREKAKAFYLKALSYNESDQSVLYNLGLIALEDEDVPAAENYLTTLYRINPDGPVTLRLGEIALEKGEGEKALAYYDQFLKKNSSDIEALNAVIDAYILQKRYIDAVARADQLLALLPADKKQDLYFKKAKVLFLEMHDYNQGMTAMTGALDNGYNDKEAIKVLLVAAPDDLRKSLVKLLAQKGITIAGY